MIEWDYRHGKILMDFLNKMDSNGIRWFILRGYKGLPTSNPSKDVDIMVEVGKEKQARELLKNTFSEAGLKFFYPVVYGHAHCYLGMDNEKHFAIHIDLIEGYISKGYQIFTFDELYKHVCDYNGLKVLDDMMNGIMLLVYKIFGYHNAKLKKEYKEDIAYAYKNYNEEFSSIILNILGEQLGKNILQCIDSNEFEEILKKEPEFTKALKKYTNKKRRFSTLYYKSEFLWQKISRIIFRYRKYAKTFAVLAPDGTGKTTFLNALLDELNFYYVNDSGDDRFHVYHFRPEVLPNLGAAGEKAGVMKQDKDFTSPHRSKPANPISSLLRITYYTFDYIIGWMKCVRKDVQYDKYSIFDRYSYDFIVDPRRTKLGLPKSVRKFFVALTPQPKIVFVLTADPSVIYKRKQELTFEEITRQVKEYRELASSNITRFIILDAEKSPDEMAKEAANILLNKYTVRL